MDGISTIGDVQRQTHEHGGSLSEINLVKINFFRGTDQDTTRGGEARSNNQVISRHRARRIEIQKYTDFHPCSRLSSYFNSFQRSLRINVECDIQRAPLAYTLQYMKTHTKSRHNLHLRLESHLLQSLQVRRSQSSRSEDSTSNFMRKSLVSRKRDSSFRETSSRQLIH